MTEKLFYKNSFMQEFDATVVSCTEDKKGWAVVLDATAFYPEGGGQPCPDPPRGRGHGRAGLPTGQY